MLLVWVLTEVTGSRAKVFVINDSKIEKVTLFPSQALVERAYTISEEIPPGYHELHLMGLVDNLDESSLNLRGTVSLEVLDTSLRNCDISLREERLVELRTLKASLEMQQASVEREMQQVEVRMKGVKDYANSLFSSPTHVTDSRLTLDRVKEVLDFQDTVLSQSSDELKKLTVELTEIRARLKHFDDEMRTLNAVNGAESVHGRKHSPGLEQGSEVQRKYLAVRIHVPSQSVSAREAGKQEPADMGQSLSSQVKLSYYTKVSYPSLSSWESEYDVKLEDKIDEEGSGTGHSLRLDYFASVKQSTAEDWEHVRLALSTTDPAHAMPMTPAVHPLRVGYSERPQPMMRMNARGSILMKKSGQPAAMEMDAPMMAESADFAGAGEMMHAPISHVSARGDLGASYLFDLTHPVSINSTNTPQLKNPSGGSSHISHSVSHRFFIQSANVDAVVYTLVVPSSDLDAYLMAHTHEFKTDTATPVLPSRSARVYVQGNYMGNSNMPAVQPGGTLSLNLGKDRGVDVSSTHVIPKKLSAEQDKSTWFVRDKKTFRIRDEEFLFTVKSMHTTNQLVLLSESLPSTGEEDVKVEPLSPTLPSDEKSRESQFVFRGKVGELSLIPTSVASDHEECRSKILDLFSGPNADNSLIGKTTTPSSGFESFLCKADNSIVWTKWMSPGETWRINYKYRTVWPDGKIVSVY